MDLKNRFSREERLKFVREQFHAGIVIKLFCDFTKPPKFKLLLVASAECARPLLFVINTEPTEFAKLNERLRDQHVPIKKATNDFLNHDSFIDCSNAFENFDKEEIEDALAGETTLMLGKICPDTAARVLESICDSHTLSRIHIDQIGMEISDIT